MSKNVFARKDIFVATLILFVFFVFSLYTLVKSVRVMDSLKLNLLKS